MKYFSMFSGIGGFELGIERAYRNQQSTKKFKDKEGRNRDSNEEGGNVLPSTITPLCVGYSEIDKYAIQTYLKHFPDHKNYGDAREIKPSELPDFDMLCGGFPCQAFSIAGKRRGFEDTRGTLFFEIARIIEVKRPKIILLENVKGLLNHNKGETFKVIIQTLSELGYNIQWMVLNSKFFGVPQNRERVFIIGSLRTESRPEILPFRTSQTNTIKDEGEIIMVNKSSNEIKRIYSQEGISPTLHLKTGGWQEPKIAIPVLTTDRLDKRQNGRRFKENNEEAFTLTKTDVHGVMVSPTLSGELAHSWGYNIQNNLPIIGQIRRLTPLECLRLQGFPDDYFNGLNISDTQKYKTLGNAVTVNVVRELANKIIVSNGEQNAL